MQVLERGNNVEIWVPNSISEVDLVAVMQKYIASGVHPVIYRSGSADLLLVTASLLQQNN